MKLKLAWGIQPILVVAALLSRSLNGTDCSVELLRIGALSSLAFTTIDSNVSHTAELR